MLAEVNMVNAPVIAKDRGVKVSETRRDAQGIYEGYIKLVVKHDRRKGRQPRPAVSPAPSSPTAARA